MTFGTLIRRSLRFHWRAHLGVVLGAAVGSAALIGALVVGDSVKGSLRERALSHLGDIHFAMVPTDRFFRAELADDFQQLYTRFYGGMYGGHFAPLMLLHGTAATSEGLSRANSINVIGVDDRFWKTATAGARIAISEGGALLNQALARQLKPSEGEMIVLRVPKPSALSRESAITPRSDASIVFRVRVSGILAPSDMGDFNLTGGQSPLYNTFVPLSALQEHTKAMGQANILLTSQWEVDLPFPISRLERAGRMLRRMVTGRFEPTLKVVTATGEYEAVKHRVPFPLEMLNDAHHFHRAWKLTDVALKLRLINASRELELSSPRVFLNSGVAEAVKSDPDRAGKEMGRRSALGQVDKASEILLAEGLSANSRKILTYLANLLRAGTNTTPYSMVTAAGPPWTPPDMRDDEILVSQWLADDLHLKPGDEIALSYFDPESGARLVERTNSFRVRSIVPMEMPWADRTLMPEFPGIEKAESTSDWDAGFPLVYKIRPKDEDYWNKYRGTPKAFITLAAGQRMWANRFGNLTAIRFPIPTNVVASECRAALEKKILTNLKPEEFGLRFEPVRKQALEAAENSQDFGGLFLGFSFFLITAALLLMALLFSLGLEQRAQEIGTVLTLGFTPKQVRRLLLYEGVALSFLGGIPGTLGGLAYAKAMIYGLTTIWRDAVGASALSFHFTGQTLAIGLFASVFLSATTIWLTLRKLVRRPVRELLVGEIAADGSDAKGRKSKIIAVGALLLALVLGGCAVARGDTSNAGIFFGAGALVLVAGLAAANARLIRLVNSKTSNRTSLSLSALGFRGCARRRKRSLATIGMLACGSFLIVSIGVFRLDANRDAWKRSSGTGGFALIGETTMPVVHDLNSPSGRDFFALNEGDLQGVNFVPFRVHAGEEASCLNLNGAQRPRLLGVKPEMLEGRFTFAKGDNWMSLISTRLQPGESAANESRNRLNGFSQPAPSNTGLKPGVNEMEIPAIGDANAIEWAMHKKVGDTIDYVDERGQPFKVRIVGAVANSILQGQLIIDEAEFVKRFPGESGYRMFLIDVPSNQVSQVSATLSRTMQDVGLELTPAAERLAQFNAVQNTYLGTFQVLGGLGLLLGSAGLGIVVLRNVLERRGELAALLAVGFHKGTLQRLLLIENGVLLTAGLALGLVAAVVAVLPALLSPTAQLPSFSLALTLGAVVANGALWTWAATRLAVRGDLLAALRNE